MHAVTNVEGEYQYSDEISYSEFLEKENNLEIPDGGLNLNVSISLKMYNKSEVPKVLEKLVLETNNMNTPVIDINNKINEAYKTSHNEIEHLLLTPGQAIVLDIKDTIKINSAEDLPEWCGLHYIENKKSILKKAIEF
ncbi:hypothetical protein [Sinobaca sp. H24]|uniref:hypothetical protein n=1 Tax=Sinobaca sp. H24 TaxID=2923376 RepID=UPI002079354F|nr:hypothetical protein [Sinobaca sp. H24]